MIMLSDINVKNTDSRQKERLFLFMRIRKHEEGVLCRQIYEEAKARGWPGLGQEVSDICQTLISRMSIMNLFLNPK